MERVTFNIKNRFTSSFIRGDLSGTVQLDWDRHIGKWRFSYTQDGNTVLGRPVGVNVNLLKGLTTEYLLVLLGDEPTKENLGSANSFVYGKREEFEIIEGAYIP